VSRIILHRLSQKVHAVSETKKSDLFKFLNFLNERVINKHFILFFTREIE